MSGVPRLPAGYLARAGGVVRLVPVLAAVLVVALGPGRAAAQPAPTVVAVELRAAQQLPEDRVRAVLDPLVGRPRRHGAVRESLEQLWGLGLFSRVRVEEQPAEGGVRLVYHLERRLHVGRIRLRGDLELPEVDVIGALGLGPDEPVDAARLARARDALRALYEREGYLHASVAIEGEVDAATGGRDLVVVVHAGERTRIEAVEVRGADEAVAIARPPLARLEGAPHRARDVREAVEAAERRLREEGFFEAHVHVTPPLGPGQGRLVADVEAGPRVRVELHGASAVPERELRERLTFAHTGIVDDPEVAASARALRAAYRERGYHFARVDGRLSREDGAVVVRFDIDEGPRVTVASIEFAGDLPVPAERLREHMATRPSALLRSAPFDEEVLERDLRAIEAFLATTGFPEAQAGPARVDFVDDRTRARVVVPVVAGRRVSVGTVTVGGASVLAPATLRAAVPLTAGGPWSAAAAEDGRRAIERRYARLGFHTAGVRVVTTPRGDVMDVAYHVQEGRPTRIGRIVIRGLTVTDESVVRRELPMREGDPLDPEQLLEAQRRLVRLGLFERVEVEPLHPRAVPWVDVHVTLREGKPWHLAFGAGYGTFEGLRGFAEVGHDNLFGTGRSALLRLRGSERGERAELVYREPWLFGTRLLGEATTFYERKEEIGYEFERLGLGLGVGRALDEYLRGLRGSLRYQISRVDRFDVDPSLARADVAAGTDIIATLTPEVTLDRRDHPLAPTRGSFHLASLEVGSAVLGSDAEFAKVRLETAWLFDWLRPTVFAFAARLGLATPYAGTRALPIEERFFAGGASTVRGYDERRLGPLDVEDNPVGGNGLLVLNAEWRFPIWRWLGGAVFVDAGAVTADVEDLGPDELRSGVGVGLRVVTPVGPLRVDVGYPLDRVRGQERELHYYITVGYPF